MNYVDPTGLWRTVALGYQAEYGDTLWGLSEKLFGNGSYWRDLGYPYDPQYERGLRVGDIIAYEGGLVEYENGQVNIRRSNILYQNGAYYTPAPMPEPPKPEPVKPAPPSAASTPKPNTGNTPTPSTSSPGNGGGGGNKGGASNMSIVYPPYFIGPPVPDELADRFSIPLQPYKGIEMNVIIYLDITYLLNPVLKETVLAAEAARAAANARPWYERYHGVMAIYLIFYALVKPGAPWDVKLPECWESTIGAKYPGYDVKVCFNGWLMTPEELGNFTYGYIGGAFGIPLNVLYAGSWYAAGFPMSGESLEGEYKDWYHIESGYMAYQSYNIRILG